MVMMWLSFLSIPGFIYAANAPTGDLNSQEQMHLLFDTPPIVPQLLEQPAPTAHAPDVNDKLPQKYIAAMSPRATVESTFNEIDTNKDNVIDRQEWDAYHQKLDDGGMPVEGEAAVDAVEVR